MGCAGKPSMVCTPRPKSASARPPNPSMSATAPCGRRADCAFQSNPRSVRRRTDLTAGRVNHSGPVSVNAGSKMRPLVLAASLVASMIAGCGGHSSEAPPASTPNILFVIMDDVGIDQMKSFGYGGATPPKMPNMDVVAAAGVRFRNTWSMPECTPGRAAMFVGRFPAPDRGRMGVCGAWWAQTSHLRLGEYIGAWKPFGKHLASGQRAVSGRKSSRPWCRSHQSGGLFPLQSLRTV